MHEYGPPESMRLEEAPRPEPGPGQVLIRNHACGLNFFDILQIAGQYQSRPEFPFVIGAEVAGEIAGTGEGVTDFQPGDRVVSMPRAGGFAEYSVAPEERTFPMPRSMSFVEAAAFPVVYQTSWFALDYRAKVEPAEWVLVQAGASGVGVAAIQIAKAKGARVIATASTEEKRAFCREQGADETVDYTQPDWPDRVKKTTGRGADVILDVVGGDVFAKSTKCIAPDGRLLTAGFTSGKIPEIAANRILLKNMSVVGVFWGRHLDEHPRYGAEAHSALMDLYDRGQLKVPVDRTFPLEEAPAALAELAERRVRGKAVLEIATSD